MWVTEYRSYSAVKTAKIKNYSWEDFVRKISRPVISYGMFRWEWEQLPEDFTKEEKENKDYDHETQQTVKQLAGGAVYGRAEFNDGEVGRADRYFPYRSALSFDYEHCGSDIYNRVKEALAGYSYCWYSTFKHSPKDNDYRIRVIVPFDFPVKWELYSFMYVEMARKIGLQGLDLSSLVRSQMMLYCVKLADVNYEYDAHTGEFLDVEEYLDAKYGTLDIKRLTDLMRIDWTEWKLPALATMTKPEKPKVIVLKSGKSIPNKQAQKDYSKVEKGDVKSCFNAVVGCRELLDQCIEYEPRGNRYKYREASSNPGVWVRDDDKICGSRHDHSGDPLNEHVYDAYNLFLLYFCKSTDTYREKMQKAHRYALLRHKDKYGELFFGKLCWNKFHKDKDK